MNSLSISNVKNILIYGDESNFQLELQALQLEGSFDVAIVDDEVTFRKYLSTDLVDLIVFDALIGHDHITDMIKQLDQDGIRKVPMILVVDHETIDERYEYFNIGITNFYERGQVSFLVDLIRRIDREETYRKSFKDMSIAILDDDKLQLKILKDILGRNGIYDVDTFEHPEDLLNAPQNYDIYLIDLILPKIDGEIVMYEIRKHHEHAIIIGVSSIEKHSTIAKVLALGANDYLVKPVNASVFMAKLYNYGKNLILRKENEMKTRVLQDLASKDGLTSLYNHRHVHEILNKFVTQAIRHDRPLAVMMLDIDNFKSLNDKHGHQYGDEVLAIISQTLLMSIRDHDIVGRYGGEEFIIILPDTTVQQGMIIGDRIRKKIKDLVFRKGVRVTISGGISQLVTDVEQLIYDADVLLYQAKKSGKDQVLCSDDKKETIDIYESC